MKYYDTFGDYAQTIPLRFTVIPPHLNSEQFRAYRDLIDRARWLEAKGANKVIMEVRGRRNLFRSEAAFDSEPVQNVLTFLQKRISNIHSDIKIVPEK